jgi:voltage-gated potassium channel
MPLLLHALSGALSPASTPNSNQSAAFHRRHGRCDHIVVIGFGAKGRAAVDAMIAQGRRPGDIVVVDAEAGALESAGCRGLLTCHGSAVDCDVLREAGVQRAAAVIVVVGLDDTAVFVVRTLRNIADTIKVLVAVHDLERAQLLRQSDGDTVVICEETAGRLLGMSATVSEIVGLIDDLLTPETGYVIAERPVEPDEIGLPPPHLSDTVIGVVRNGRLTKPHHPSVGSLITGDRILFVRLRK